MSSINKGDVRHSKSTYLSGLLLGILGARGLLLLGLLLLFPFLGGWTKILAGHLLVLGLFR